jgi:hypothetical protein
MKTYMMILTVTIMALLPISKGAHAFDSGFETSYFPSTSIVPRKALTAKNTFQDLSIRLDRTASNFDSSENEWSMHLNAERDTVLFDDASHTLQNDRVPMDHGNRNAMRFGVDLKYGF